MKKHNEGYALVLVLVVITVLCLVAMAMTAASLKNLQNQQKSIERMEVKYAAQGEIEKAVSILEKKFKTEDTIAFSQDALNTTFGGIIDEVTASYQKIGEDSNGNPFDPSLDYDYILLTLKAREQAQLVDTTVIECTVVYEMKITGSINNTNVLSISKGGIGWQCVSYTITENIPDPTTEVGGGAG